MNSATLTKPIVLPVPPLENGDRLTRIEFEYRYSAMPHLKKAELIDGIVYLGSPVRITQHGEPHANIMAWLGHYWSGTPGIELGDNSTVRLDDDNEPQPDALLRVRTGGNSTISEDGYVEGAPELIVEIAASTVSLDLHKKLDVYKRLGVQEYLVWRVEDEALDWFKLESGNYISLEPNDKTGLLCSEVFPGLRLDKTALLAGNLARVIEVVQQGFATVEHGDFVQRLVGRNKQD